MCYNAKVIELQVNGHFERSNITIVGNSKERIWSATIAAAGQLHRLFNSGWSSLQNAVQYYSTVIRCFIDFRPACHHRPKIPGSSTASHLWGLRVSTTTLAFYWRRHGLMILLIRSYPPIQFSRVWRCTRRVRPNIRSLFVSGYPARSGNVDRTGLRSRGKWLRLPSKVRPPYWTAGIFTVWSPPRFKLICISTFVLKQKTSPK